MLQLAVHEDCLIFGVNVGMRKVPKVVNEQAKEVKSIKNVLNFTWNSNLDKYNNFYIIPLITFLKPTWNENLQQPDLMTVVVLLKHYLKTNLKNSLINFIKLKLTSVFNISVNHH